MVHRKRNDTCGKYRKRKHKKINKGKSHHVPDDKGRGIQQKLKTLRRKTGSALRGMRDKLTRRSRRRQRTLQTAIEGNIIADLALMDAVRENADLGRLEELLHGGANIDAVSMEGKTPLILASERGQSRVVDWLLSHGADYNISDIDGRNPFFHAADNGHLDVLHQLRRAGYAGYPEDRIGDTSIYAAAEKGHTDVVRYLIGRSPRRWRAELHRAIENEDNEMINLLASNYSAGTDAQTELDLREAINHHLRTRGFPDLDADPGALAVLENSDPLLRHYVHSRAGWFFT
jgi:hypothetical protein